MKCKVLKKTLLVVEENSIVEVDAKQYECAKHLLQPIVEEESKAKKEKKRKE